MVANGIKDNWSQARSDGAEGGSQDPCSSLGPLCRLGGSASLHREGAFSVYPAGKLRRRANRGRGLPGALLPAAPGPHVQHPQPWSALISPDQPWSALQTCLHMADAGLNRHYVAEGVRIFSQARCGLPPFEAPKCLVQDTWRQICGPEGGARLGSPAGTSQPRVPRVQQAVDGPL